MIKFGLGHPQPRAATSGSLALFCPACPQPGINLPEDWAIDADHWKYQRVFVMDGNFAAENMKSRGTNEDINLTEDAGYFTGVREYDEHLSTAPDVQPVSNLNDECVSA
jgi:hypothetical protein